MLAALLLTGSAGASIVNVLAPHIGPPEAGFTGEIAAGVSAQRAFYDAMMSDVAGKRVPESWRKGLYEGATRASTDFKHNRICLIDAPFLASLC